MLKIIINGINGRLGSVIHRVANEHKEIEVVGGVDICETGNEGVPVFPNFEKLNIRPDVIIDASHPSALEGILKYSIENHVPTILATTGYSKEQEEMIQKASESVSIFHSSNLSLGINLLSQLSETAARVLGNDFDIEIVEAHHNQKLDAPSGTAIMLAHAVESGLSYTPHYVYERESYRRKRDKKEIGIHSIRGGTIVGEHQVIFAGRDEIITLSHSARSKEIFAVGALNAALFMADKETGFYSMTDVIQG